MYTPQAGDHLIKDGKTIVIHFVENGQVYYCINGSVLERRTIAQFVHLVEAEQPTIVHK